MIKGFCSEKMCTASHEPHFWIWPRRAQMLIACLQAPYTFSSTAIANVTLLVQYSHSFFVDYWRVKVGCRDAAVFPLRVGFDTIITKIQGCSYQAQRGYLANVSLLLDPVHIICAEAALINFST